MKKVSLGCQYQSTECSGHSAVFVAVARANGIPARMISGQNGKESVGILHFNNHFVYIILVLLFCDKS